MKVVEPLFPNPLIRDARRAGFGATDVARAAGRGKTRVSRLDFLLRRAPEVLFENPLGYRYVRRLFHVGVRLTPIRRAPALKDGDRVLDVGCETGDYSVIVHSPRRTYLCVDISVDLVRLAQRLYANEFRRFEVGTAVRFPIRRSPSVSACFSESGIT